MTASNRLMSSNGNLAAAIFPASDGTEVRMVQLEDRNCSGTQFKGILKRQILEDHDTDDFCFINKYPFSICSDNP